VTKALERSMGRRRSHVRATPASLIQQLGWATARLIFLAYIGASMATLGLFGFATGPVMTWYFYGDWRFWRVWHSAKGLYPHAYKMLGLVLRGQNGGFMLAVPLNARPRSGVDPAAVELNPTWEFGSACGPCSRCCSKIACPVLDRDSGLCRGYDSFFWRYFNCGRYPSSQPDIDYYLCNKWVVIERPEDGIRARPEAATAEEMVA